MRDALSEIISDTLSSAPQPASFNSIKKTSKLLHKRSRKISQKDETKIRRD